MSEIGIVVHARCTNCLLEPRTDHAIFLDQSAQVCSSTSLPIACKTSEFDFRAEGVQTLLRSLRSTTPSLTATQKFERGTRSGCHSSGDRTRHEPLPRSITFISPNSPDNLSRYFKALVREFEQKTLKPTRHQLANIGVAVQPSFGPVSPNIPTSQFKAGDWLVGLFCPIPSHIAVTGQNPFIPLRNGVMSQEFEQSFLGADVGRIAEAYALWHLSSTPVLIYPNLILD